MGDWAGYGIGGLSVGEPKPAMYAALAVTDASLPRDRVRYLMGVGFPEDLLEAIRLGVDLFDCVAPTRMGRNGTAFTSSGRLNVRRAELRSDGGATLSCDTCRAPYPVLDGIPSFIAPPPAGRRHGSFLRAVGGRLGLRRFRHGDPRRRGRRPLSAHRP